jgi:hypothetical protein
MILPPERRNFARIDRYRCVYRMVRGLSHLSLFHNAHRGSMRSCAGARARAIERGAALVPLPITLLLCATLGGCAGGFQGVYTSDFWVEPGKYEFLKCPDLAKRTLSISVHEKQVVSEMERAKDDVAGSLINAAVYQADLQQTRADLEAMRRAAHEKGCDSLVPPAKK